MRLSVRVVSPHLSPSLSVCLSVSASLRVPSFARPPFPPPLLLVELFGQEEEGENVGSSFRKSDRKVASEWAPPASCVHVSAHAVSCQVTGNKRKEAEAAKKEEDDDEEEVARRDGGRERERGQ